jgi:putative DNA primase/helicase
MRDGGSGLLPPKCVVDETREYQRDEDVIGRFVEECCELGAHAKVRAGDVYRAYKEYCKREGIDDPASSNMFAEALKRISYADGKRVAKKRDGAGRYYEGIGLPASDDGDPRVPDDDPESWV